MALVEDALFTRLTTHAGLSALISVRAYPMKMPQEHTLPLVVYQRVTTQHHHAMGSDAAVQSPTYQVSGWATTYEAARALRAQLVAALSRWRGTVVTTGGNVVIQDALLENELDVYEDESGEYACSLDVIIHHEAG